MNNEIFAYLCPKCKTPNKNNIKYCVKCGHWMLDSTFNAIPITEKEYTKGFKFNKKKVPILTIIGLMLITILIASKYLPTINTLNINSNVINKIEFSKDITLKMFMGYTTVISEAKNLDYKEHALNITITFYDENKKIIGTASGGLVQFKPGETKTYELIGQGDFTKSANRKIQIDSIK